MATTQISRKTTNQESSSEDFPQNKIVTDQAFFTSQFTGSTINSNLPLLGKELKKRSQTKPLQVTAKRTRSEQI